MDGHHGLPDGLGERERLGVDRGFAGIPVDVHHDLLVAAGVDVPPVGGNERRFQSLEDHVLRQTARLTNLVEC